MRQGRGVAGMQKVSSVYSKPSKLVLLVLPRLLLSRGQQWMTGDAREATHQALPLFIPTSQQPDLCTDWCTSRSETDGAGGDAEAQRERAASVCPGHRGHQRPSVTAETAVVRLITQRS